MTFQQHLFVYGILGLIIELHGRQILQQKKKFCPTDEALILRHRHFKKRA